MNFSLKLSIIAVTCYLCYLVSLSRFEKKGFRHKHEMIEIFYIILLRTLYYWLCCKKFSFYLFKIYYFLFISIHSHTHIYMFFLFTWKYFNKFLSSSTILCHRKHMSPSRLDRPKLGVLENLVALKSLEKKSMGEHGMWRQIFFRENAQKSFAFIITFSKTSTAWKIPKYRVIPGPYREIRTKNNSKNNSEML